VIVEGKISGHYRVHATMESSVEMSYLPKQRCSLDVLEPSILCAVAFG
jgi:hypothetical protein